MTPGATRQLPPFIATGGCPRSGTTLLMFLLNSDPRAFISAEENVLRCADGLLRVLDTRERLRRKTGGGTRAMSQRERWPERGVDPYHFSGDAFPDILWSVYRHHLAALGRGSDLEVWGDKFPKYFESLAELFALPLTIRYLHITRNPFDVINSMLRRTEMARQDRDWWRAATDIDEMIDTWNHALRVILDREARDDVLHIQYEDLIFERNTSLARLSAFTGATPHAAAAGIEIVDDPGDHFDRSYLDEAAAEHVRQRIHLDAYVEYLRITGTGQASLQHLGSHRC